MFCLKSLSILILTITCSLALLIFGGFYIYYSEQPSFAAFTVFDSVVNITIWVCIGMFSIKLKQ
jgi:hypothetical protein